MMSGTAAEIWIALDNEHSPQRAWCMVGDRPHPNSPHATDLSFARRIAPDADVLTFPGVTDLALPVPARLDAVSAKSRTSDPGGTFPLTALSQSRPHGRLAGAACRIDGFLSLNADWDGVVCVPGFKLSHWVQISAGEAVSFLSFATTPLVQSLAMDLQNGDAAPDVDAMGATLQDVMSSPEKLALRLAEARTDFDTGTISATTALGQLWGAALGAELAAARAYWLGQNLALISPDALAAPYRQALAAQYVPVTEVNEERVTLAGFARARRRQLNQ